jgi:hypothetical protein
LPALGSLLIENVLKLFARHLAAEHALAEFDYRVLVSIRHVRTILALGIVPAMIHGRVSGGSA